MRSVDLSRDWKGVACTLGLSLLLSTCSPPSDVPRGDHGLLAHDFVAVESGVSSSKSPLEAKEISCDDETFVAWTLEAGEELSLVMPLHGEATLVLSGCAPPRSSDVARLAIEAGPVDGAPTVVAEVEGEDAGWWTREVDLSSLAGTEAQLRIRLDLPAGEVLYLSELLIEADGTLPSYPSEPPAQIILISVDTLREDAIAALGGKGKTPALDRLVEESEVFAPHYASAAWTKPSHASLLTGHYSEVHGAGINPETQIREGLVSLADRFREGGFLTAGLVYDCVWLDPEFGFARGFDVYSVLKGRAPRISREAGNWMARHRDQPFFFFVHTFEVHSDFHALPYESPGVNRATVEDRFGVSNYGCREGTCASSLLALLKEGKTEPLEQEEEILRFLYGESVSYLDSELGRLFERRRDLGMWEGLTVVLTSDHGEQFFEHGGVEHGSYWEEVLRVPLVIKWPEGRLAGTRREIPSSSVDIAPTLLAAHGLAIDELPGTVLADRRRDEPIFAGDLWRMMRLGDSKAIYDFEEKRRFLFDLEADPMELEDLSEERREELDRLSGIFGRHQESLKRWIEAGELSQSREISEEDKKRLKSLGYLGGNG